MEFGINIRNWGPTATCEFLTDSAKIADASNLDALWFNDHIGFPPKIQNNIYGIPEAMGSIIDPLGFGCFLAAVTQRIRFGTGVLVAPYRPALITNKLITAIQILSGERFLLGIGAGYLEEEFKALGVPVNKRGKITDEMLSFLNGSSANPEVTVNEQPFLLKPTLPKPPIYIGQKAEVAFPRAVKHGNGWMPVSQSPEELKPQIDKFQSMASDANRDHMEVIAMKSLPIADRNQTNDLACSYQEAGVTQLVHTQGYDSVKHYAEVVEQVDSLRHKLKK